MKPKLIIFGDPQRQNAGQAFERFMGFSTGKAEIIANCFRKSEQQSALSVDLLEEADFAVVFGGDGTILSAARQLSGADVPVIGVNVGRLGFLAEFSILELERLFERIVSDESLIEKRMILDCCVQNKEERKFSSTAINDVVIAAGAPFRMIELKITVQGQALTGCLGDGIIISTPTGSTAHNLSAGGPILSADLSAIVITPLCPHSLSFRPIVIDAENIVDIHSVHLNEGTTISLDGKIQWKLEIDDIITIQRSQQGRFQVVNNPMRTQWDTLAEKLNWACKPKYNKS